MAVDVFSVPVFLIVFRESLETVIIVAVLLAFLKQTLDGPDQDKQVYKKLVRQVSRMLLSFPVDAHTWTEHRRANPRSRYGLESGLVCSFAWSSLAVSLAPSTPSASTTGNQLR